ncbi:MAG: hypothetical protein ACI4SM_00385 [Candidatus Gastranaerophilaceae bacterium]
MSKLSEAIGVNEDEIYVYEHTFGKTMFKIVGNRRKIFIENEKKMEMGWK